MRAVIVLVEITGEVLGTIVEAPGSWAGRGERVIFGEAERLMYAMELERAIYSGPEVVDMPQPARFEATVRGSGFHNVFHAYIEPHQREAALAVINSHKREYQRRQEFGGHVMRVLREEGVKNHETLTDDSVKGRMEGKVVSLTAQVLGPNGWENIK